MAKRGSGSDKWLDKLSVKWLHGWDGQTFLGVNRRHYRLNQHHYHRDSHLALSLACLWLVLSFGLKKVIAAHRQMVDLANGQLWPKAAESMHQFTSDHFKSHWNESNRNSYQTSKLNKCDYFPQIYLLFKEKNHRQQ